MSRIMTIGDLHGNYKGLMQALERSNFNYKNDTLISLGDIVDGHSQTYEVVEELLKIKNLICIKGNHDDWFNKWIQTGNNIPGWRQGQDATALSYIRLKNSTITEATPYTIPHLLKPEDIPNSHVKFFADQIPYYIDDENNLFIHGGFNRHFLLKEQEEDIFWWDRDLWHQALSFESMQRGTFGKENWKPKLKTKDDFKTIFIGHTSTQFWGKDTPMKAANVRNLDTGGGWFGKITIMDVKSKKYWQSDDAKSLYPEFKGRK